MPSLDVAVSCPVTRSPRVMQIEAMYDVPPSQRSERTWHVDLPIESLDWSVGLICGPSGTGKSTVARKVFGDIDAPLNWSPGKSILDEFPREMSIHDVLAFMGGVGFSSTPSWFRPYQHLSNGEQFRVSMARRLAEASLSESKLAVVDEFTSVVDRQVAQIVSHGVQRVTRARGLRFVAVSCHSDIIDWLQPDWIYFPASNEFVRRELQRRPCIQLDVCRVPNSAWTYFKQHHYLSGKLQGSAISFGGFVGEKCIAFSAITRFPHPRAKNIMKGHRTVVLPDWQGIGIGGRLDDWIGEWCAKSGQRYLNTVAHPAMIAYYNKSPRWRLLAHSNVGPEATLKIGTTSKMAKRMASVRVLQLRSFEYIPERFRR